MDINEYSCGGDCITLPRFTFKSSGADVSASILFLEKREKGSIDLSEDYSFAVEMIEKVGWDAGNKTAAPLYVRAKEDGCLIIGDDNEPIIDSDFPSALENVISSEAANTFAWLAVGREKKENTNAWTMNINKVYEDVYFTLDPKRYCRKFVELRDKIKERDYFKLGELVDFIPEKTSSNGKK